MNTIRKILNYELYDIEHDEPLWKSALVWSLYATSLSLLWILAYAVGGR